MYINKEIYKYPDPRSRWPDCPMARIPNWCSRVLANNCSGYFFTSAKTRRRYDNIQEEGQKKGHSRCCTPNPDRPDARLLEQCIIFVISKECAKRNVVFLS